jgi:hypothetical protein
VSDFSTKLKLRRYGAVLEQYCSNDDWVLYADGDEFHVYPRPLPEFLRDLAARQIDYATGHLIDRLAPDGVLERIRSNPTLWDQFPFGGTVTASIVGGWTRKVCVARGSLRLAEGGAHALRFGGDVNASYARTHADRPSDTMIEIHHFKWDASLRSRLADKLSGASGDRERVDGAHFMSEYRNLALHLRCHSRIVVDDVRWLGTPLLQYVDFPEPRGSV